MAQVPAPRGSVPTQSSPGSSVVPCPGITRGAEETLSPWGTPGCWGVPAWHRMQAGRAELHCPPGSSSLRPLVATLIEIQLREASKTSSGSALGCSAMLLSPQTLFPHSGWQAWSITCCSCHSQLPPVLSFGSPGNSTQASPCSRPPTLPPRCSPCRMNHPVPEASKG